MHSRHYSGLDRKLGTSLSQSLFGHFCIRSVHFKNYSTRQHIKTISLWISFSLSHAYLSRLGCIRTIRKGAHPVLAGLGKGSRNHLASRLDLSRFYASLLSA